jgi:hypothetical protein
MITEDEKLEKVRGYLEKRRALFFVVYRGMKSETGLDLQWIRAMSAETKTREDRDKLAAKYQALALRGYQTKRNMIIEAKNGTGEGKPWHGFKIPTGEVTPSPANSLGERWWTLVIASGTTNKAGYAIVTRILAKASTELPAHIAYIQAIVRSRGYKILGVSAWLQRWGLASRRR